jgi:hypothetical protein
MLASLVLFRRRVVSAGDLRALLLDLLDVALGKDTWRGRIWFPRASIVSGSFVVPL